MEGLVHQSGLRNCLRVGDLRLVLHGEYINHFFDDAHIDRIHGSLEGELAFWNVGQILFEEDGTQLRRKRPIGNLIWILHYILIILGSSMAITLPFEYFDNL